MCFIKTRNYVSFICRNERSNDPKAETNKVAICQMANWGVIFRDNRWVCTDGDVQIYFNLVTNKS